MTPARMAEIAAACWPDRADRWKAESIETMLAQDNTFAVSRPEGFAIVRHSPFDAELLSIDVLPDRQGHGIGRDILAEAMARAHDLGGGNSSWRSTRATCRRSDSTTGRGSSSSGGASAITANPMEPGPTPMSWRTISARRTGSAHPAGAG
jgi:GNAT superfamily N-acetyltransferase